MIERVRISIRGAVQGVGFRPHVHRLATGAGLTGWVLNSPEGVFVEAEGERPELDRFILRLPAEKPPRAFITSFEFSFTDPAGDEEFRILPSRQGGVRRTLVMPDIATCSECLAEIFDPAARRHLYPFTNCTQCGPRFSIIEELPYDRSRTSMKSFVICSECRAEYENPADRRFHAQPIACPECGPTLEAWTPHGEVLARHHDALLLAARAIRHGEIVALKGLGGFQLLVDARDETAVRRLRFLKHREDKPLAVMAPDLDRVRAVCHAGPFEERLLGSPEAPIVLLERWAGGDGGTPAPGAGGGSGGPVVAPAEAVAPGNPCLGVMLPYTPLHHILMRELGFFVVATSGNLSEEPMAIDEREALKRLAGIADLFLVHNRPIARHVDDSIVRVMLGREQVLRRARGYAPLPVELAGGGPAILGVGAHVKSTIALAVDGQAFLSQHIGDLENRAAVETFEKVIADFGRLYGASPETVAADAHPDYASTRFALAAGPPVVRVQHHVAHVAACLADNGVEGPVLGVSWDGTGYGTDGTVWGGEFLRLDGDGYERVAHLRPFRLPGGEAAVREPRRAALGVLFEVAGAGIAERDDLPPLKAFDPRERRVLVRMLERGLNAPVTTSAGRLFDAVASLAGLKHETRFEGQAAMELEYAALAGAARGAPGAYTLARGAAAAYPFQLRESNGGAPLVVDWEPTLLALVADVERGAAAGEMAARFHITLSEMILTVARRIGEPRVVLTGGCFQNRLLTEESVRRLGAGGFRPYWHQRVPPNDGGIALGQVAWAAGAGRRKSHVPGGSR